MYRYILFLICFLSVFIGQAQGDINQMDAEGKRHGVWRKHYNNNRIRYSGTFDHGKEIGVFKYYSASNSDFPILVREYEDQRTEKSDEKFCADLRSPKEPRPCNRKSCSRFNKFSNIYCCCWISISATCTDSSYALRWDYTIKRR